MALDLAVFYATESAGASGGGAGLVLARHNFATSPAGPVPTTTNGSGSYDPGPLFDASAFSPAQQAATVVVDADGEHVWRLVPDPQLGSLVGFLRDDGSFGSVGELVSGRLTFRIADYLEDDGVAWTTGINVVITDASGDGYILHANKWTGVDATPIPPESVLQVGRDVGGVATLDASFPLATPLAEDDEISLEWSPSTLAAFRNGVLVGEPYAIPLADRIDSATFVIAGVVLRIYQDLTPGGIADVSPGVETMILTPYGVAA